MGSKGGKLGAMGRKKITNATGRPSANKVRQARGIGTKVGSSLFSYLGEGNISVLQTSHVMINFEKKNDM